jgi:GNAT superfamily N-acetyltransferase
MSRAEVRPAGPDDIEPVCRLLHEKMNPRIAPERWRRLMSYPWLADKPDLGRVALVAGEVVGFAGMVHAERELAGRRERVVNICAWYLDPAHRGRGLGFELMRSATEDETMSYTILTSSARTLGLLDGLGYRVLERELKLWRADGRGDGALDLTEDEELILERASEAERRMLADHAGLAIRPVLISDGRAACLAIFWVKKKGADVTYFDVLHLSQPAFFARHAQAIADRLLPRDRPSVLAVDSRLLGGAKAGGAIEPLKVARYYKSNRLQPHQIDNMYSEIQLLDLKLD